MVSHSRLGDSCVGNDAPGREIDCGMNDTPEPGIIPGFRREDFSGVAVLASRHSHAANFGAPIITGNRAVSRSTTRTALLISTSVTLVASLSAQAADSDPRDDSSIPFVIVSATPLPGADIDRSRIPAPVQTVTAQDIERSHALDVSAFMNRTLGSVYVNDIQNNPVQPDISYRGFTASPLLGTPQGLSVYMDGVRLNQPFGDVVSWDLIPRAGHLDDGADAGLESDVRPQYARRRAGSAHEGRLHRSRLRPRAELRLELRRGVTLEAGAMPTAASTGTATANKLEDDGWRDDSPTDAGQVFAKFGWRNDATDIALTGAYADTRPER